MSFRWDYETPSGDPKGASQEFESKQQAEDFIAREFQDLLDDGVEAVVLKDGDAVVYRMKITPDDSEHAPT